MNKKDTIKFFLDRGILVSPDFIENIPNDFSEDIFVGVRGKISYLNKDLYEGINKGIKNISLDGFEEARVLYEQGIENVYGKFVEKFNTNSDIDNNGVDLDKPKNEIEIIKQYSEHIKKRTAGDFVSFFRHRYNELKDILIKRTELQGTLSINRVLNKDEGEVISVIGLIKDKRITKNGNILLILEEMSGEILAVVHKNSSLFSSAEDLVFDEVIGVTGVLGKGIIFVKDILFPEIPVSHEMKKGPEEEYAVFTSDIHVGSKMFFEKEFLKFVDWLNGKYGNAEQRRISKKVKYLFIIGDLVEGVGIYPNQDKDLNILDIYEQYEMFTKYIEKIRKDIEIIIIGGNHDALRLSEPQPVIDPNYANSLYKLSNITFLTNPSVVNIGKKDNFPGFSVLMYHGFSFIYYAEEVESIRKAGKLECSDLIMKFLLQKRHLAPSHQSNLYIPDAEEDPLVIDSVPDFFVSGHIHKISTSNYRGVTMINAGCWIDQTDYQEKQGMIPDPNKVVLVNLKNRAIKILNFGR